MLRERRITPVRPVRFDPSISNPLRVQQAAFVTWSRVVGFAEQTALIRRSALDHFIRWCDEQTIGSASEITAELLERYQGSLFTYRKSNGRPLALSTQVARLHPLKAFCAWLARTHQLSGNPAADLLVPNLPRRLPGRVLTPQEVERIMAQVDLGNPSGIRDRAILEILYSTGIRRMELVRIERRDLHIEHATLFVRRGKGGRDRIVPIGRRACVWTEHYLTEVRPTLESRAGSKAAFLTDYGEPFEKDRLGDLVKRYIRGTHVDVPGACHAFRHACATHMLENGADIRYIQELLGHACLSTTQIYTRVSIEKLRDVHRRTHPACGMAG